MEVDRILELILGFFSPGFDVKTLIPPGIDRETKLLWALE